MINSYFKRVTYTLFAYGCSVLTLFSCVDNKYDLSGTLDKDISVGGSLSLPLGSTEEITLKSMLDSLDSDLLSSMDGVYKISMKDSIIESITLDDGGIVIDGIVESEDIDIEFDVPQFPSFNLEVPSSTIAIDVDFNNLEFGNGEVINQTNDIAINIPSATSILLSIPNQTISEVEIPLTNSESSFPFTIKGVACTEEIESVVDILFGNDENGTDATIMFDLSCLSQRLTSSEIKIPFIEVALPSGFILNNSTNSVREENLVANSNGIIEFSFKITGYDKLSNVDGMLEDIIGNITCTLADNVTISGTTNGAVVSSNQLSLNVNTTIGIYDATLNIQNVEVPVPAKDLTEEVTISGIPSLINSVNYIALDNSSIKIDISAIDLKELNASGASDVYLSFPKDIFTLAANSNIDSTSSVDFYKLPISLGDLIDNKDYSSNIEVKSLSLKDQTLESVVVDGIEEKQVKFNPNIKLSSVDLVLSGSMNTFELNDILKEPKEMAIDVTTGSWSVVDAAIETSRYIADIDKITNDINISTSIPKELCRIDSVDFKSNNVEVKIDINLNNLDNIDSDLSFYNFIVDFPKFLTFSKESGVENNRLILNDLFDNVDGVRTYSINLAIDKLDFTDSEYANLITGTGDDKELNIIDAIEVTGAISLDAADINISDLPNDIIGEINVTLNTMEVGTAYGIIETDIEIEPTTIDLSDLSGEFDDELSAVLSNPSITIEAVNSISVPLQITELVLQPVKNGVNLETIYIDEAIDILPADGENTTTTNIYISANDITTDDGVEYVKLNNFKNLLKDMPDYISVEIKAGVKEAAAGENHMLDLSKDEYEFEIKYNLDIPLSFDELTLDYSTVIDDLGGDISELFDYISSLELEIEATNTLPISLEISSIVPLDADGNEITSLPSFINDGENVIAAESTSSIIRATIEDSSAGDIKALDGLDIRIKANITSTEGGKELKPDQYIKLKITARLPEGLSFNLDDLEDEE